MQTDLFTSGLRMSELFFLLLYLWSALLIAMLHVICFGELGKFLYYELWAIVIHNLFWQSVGSMYMASRLLYCCVDCIVLLIQLFLAFLTGHLSPSNMFRGQLNLHVIIAMGIAMNEV